MTRYVYAFLLTLSSAWSCAQPGNKYNATNAIRFDYGIVHNRIINSGYTGTNLLFRGTNNKFGIGYSRETGKSSLYVSGLVSLGDLTSTSGNLPSELTSIDVAAAYLRRIATFRPADSKNATFAGIRVSSINYYMANEAVIDNIDIFSLHGCYIDIRHHLQLSEIQSLQFTYAFPLIVYENRVLWNGGASNITYEDRENILKTLTTRGRFQYFNAFRNMQIGINYSRKIGRRTDLELQYRFFYLNSFREAPIRLYSNELLMGLKFRLGR